MTKMKILAASLAMAFSVGSQAAMTLPTASTGSSLFVTAWVDGVVTYARNLGITMSDLLNNPVANSATAPNAAWVSNSGAFFDKTTYTNFSGDANWTASNLSTLYGSSTVRWNITAAEAGAAPISYLSTFDLAISPGVRNGTTINANATTVGTYINALTTPSNFSVGPTPDCAANNSCYTTNLGSSVIADGSPFGANWAGSDTAGEGSEGISFWYYRAPNTSFTNFAPIQFANATDIGRWYLEADGDVRYELNGPAAIPVPGALWLFGSGLLGLIGVSRRRKAALNAQAA